MGYNTTVVVLNDALSSIENDPEFGKKLVAAIRKCSYYVSPERPIDVSAGSHVNAAHVVETHHADATSIVCVGGNLGKLIGLIHEWHFPREVDLKSRIAKFLAEDLS